MARPKSDEKRKAILEAAIEVIASQGLAASTATIAKQAGVAHGSLFKYFETKVDLINAVFLLLKEDLNDAVLEHLPDTSDTRLQFQHLWKQWMHWGASNPARRRALAQLSVSDQITEKSRSLSFERAAVGIDIVLRAASVGLFAKQSIGFVATIVEAVAGATIDRMILEPEQAESCCDISFNALWKALH